MCFKSRVTFITLTIFILCGATACAESFLHNKPDAYSGYLMPELFHPYEPAATTAYGRPYSRWENEIDMIQLKRNTLVLFGAGIGVLGALYLMPSSFTNWEDSGGNPLEKWWNNVSHGPVWDEDDYILNYVAHPYAGGIYYMVARSAGANMSRSFLYSFMLSTFFWEYGIEAFAEIPSIQDLIVTPVAGALLGEGFYLAKRHIINNDYRLLNSRILGHFVALLIDPVTEISGLFTGSGNSNDVAFIVHPTVTMSGRIGYQLALRIEF